MTLYDSIYRITHGTTVIVDYGDPLTAAGLVLDGQQLVTPVEPVKGAGILTIARANESHQIQIEKLEPEYSTRNALVSAFTHALAAPRDSRDLLIELENGWAWRIESATVESWTGQTEGILATRTLSILGGKLSQVSAGTLDAPEETAPPPTMDSGGVTMDSNLITMDAAS